MSAERLRPQPPDLLFLALGLWVGTAITFYQSCLPGAPPFWVYLSVLVGFLVLGVCGRVFLRKGGRIFSGIFLAILGLALGVLGGMVAANSLVIQQDLVAKDYQGEYVFEIVEDPNEGEFGSSCYARTKLANDTQIQVRLLFSQDDPGLKFGDIFHAKALLRTPPKSAQEYYWCKGVVAVATVHSGKKLERSDLYGMIIEVRSQAIELFSGEEKEGAALLRAILFGERSSLDKDGLYRDVRVVGLAHLVAVSGAHLVIVSSSVGLLLRMLHAPRFLIIIIQLLLVIAYLIFTGIPLSALRAALMASISFLSFFAKRRGSSLNALALVIVVIVVASPSSSLSIAFLLSALSTLGIVVFSSLLQGWFVALSPNIPHYIREGLSLTLAASIPITLLTASLFSQVSLLSPLANLIAAPFFTLICVLGLIIVIAALAMPFLGSFCLPLILFLAQAFTDLIRLMAQVPYAAIPCSVDLMLALVVSFFVFVIFWVWWPQLSRLTILGGSALATGGLLLYLTFSPYFHHDEIIMLDVGQGDAFLVRSQGKTVLIDTGNRDSDLLKGLGRHQVYALDAIVISHADDDHCGSLSALKGYVRVENICIARPVLDCGCDSCKKLLVDSRDLVGEGGIQALSLEDTISVGDFNLEVIWPLDFADEGGNADSLSLLLTARRSHDPLESVSKKDSKEDSTERAITWKVLFCGDAEKEELTSMIERGCLGDIDILKVGHHGSKNALTEEIISVLEPELTLISVGKNNRYGHPAQTTLDILENVPEIMRTDLEGDVVCRLSPDRIEVRSVG